MRSFVRTHEKDRNMKLYEMVHEKRLRNSTNVSEGQLALRERKSTAGDISKPRQLQVRKRGNKA